MLTVPADWHLAFCDLGCAADYSFGRRPPLVL
jgi:hypothetical protein